ncbi:MAG: AMP-binding protein [Hyphomicrobiaceae bacterium]
MGDVAEQGTVYRLISAVAGRLPGKTALIHDGRSLTYAELKERIDHTAWNLHAAGVGYGDRFAVFAESCPDILISYYAASKIGAVMVPINPNMTAAEVGHAATHCEANLLYHDDAVASTAAQALPGTKLRPLADLSKPGHAADVGEDPRIDADDDCVIVYTSGSTGTPKAIVLSHRSQTGVLASLAEMWGITESDTTLVGLPLGYLYGLSTAATTQLACGGTVALMRRFHPGKALEAFVASRATVYQGVPTMFSMMLDYAEQQRLDIDLSGVRVLICAGAPLPEELKSRFATRFGKEIQNYYALSECTPVFGFYASDPVPPPPGAAGKLAPGSSARILDADGRECPAGTPGELLVRAAATMKRYHKDPDNTRAVLVDGWIRTGDIATKDQNGFYAITGRLKDIIIRGGANISPAEVEGVLARHPAVQEVAVIGMPDRIFGEVPVAFVVSRAGRTVTVDELVTFAAEVLADFKIPRQMRFVDELPLGQTGKVDRKALRSRWTSEAHP